MAVSVHSCAGQACGGDTSWRSRSSSSAGVEGMEKVMLALRKVLEPTDVPEKEAVAKTPINADILWACTNYAKGGRPAYLQHTKQVKLR